jgi:ssDNA-binding Zn-finger/Zn-ribbon topoisomerase 1
MKNMVAEDLLKILACPKCKGSIEEKGMFLICKKCKLAYPIFKWRRTRYANRRCLELRKSKKAKIQA